uniref:Uncharacterized protein n=1 Tax=Cacopsylla melanoneura TaxID=428564 RepID=A0A8D8QDQ7_9HEMI
MIQGHLSNTVAFEQEIIEYPLLNNGDQCHALRWTAPPENTWNYAFWKLAAIWCHFQNLSLSSGTNFPIILYRFQQIKCSDVCSLLTIFSHFTFVWFPYVSHNVQVSFLIFALNMSTKSLGSTVNDYRAVFSE